MKRNNPSNPKDQFPLTTAWWDAVIEAWNRSESRGLLAGLGSVCFGVLDDTDIAPVTIEWDASGNACRIDNSTAKNPTFRGTAANWRGFLNGDFTSTMGVLQGRIRYEGEILKILPYSNSFNRLGEIARQVTYSRSRFE